MSDFALPSKKATEFPCGYKGVFTLSGGRAGYRTGSDFVLGPFSAPTWDEFAALVNAAPGWFLWATTPGLDAADNPVDFCICGPDKLSPLTWVSRLGPDPVVVPIEWEDAPKMVPGIYVKSDGGGECVPCIEYETLPASVEPYHTLGSWGPLSDYSNLMAFPVTVDGTGEPLATTTHGSQYRFDLSHIPADAVVKQLKLKANYYGLVDTRDPNDDADLTLALTLWDGAATTGLAGYTTDTASSYWGDYVPGAPYDPAWNGPPPGNQWAGGLFGAVNPARAGTDDPARMICVVAESKADGSPILGSDLANLIAPIWHQIAGQSWVLASLVLCVEYEDRENAEQYDKNINLTQCAINGLASALKGLAMATKEEDDQPMLSHRVMEKCFVRDARTDDGKIYCGTLRESTDMETCIVTCARFTADGIDLVLMDGEFEKVAALTDGCEGFPDLTVQRPLPNNGWNNELIRGEYAFVSDLEMSFKVNAPVDGGDRSLQIIGLDSNPGQSAGLTVDYGVYLYKINGIRRLYVRENNVNAFSNTSATAWANGDVFTIRRTGTTISYLQNGTVFYTSAIPSTLPLCADSTFHTAAAWLGQFEVTEIKVCSI